MPAADSPIVAARRRRLQEWLDTHFGEREGQQTRFIAATKINQGELSGLLKSKSFGEKRAASLEAQAGMPAGYLVNPLSEAASRSQSERQDLERIADATAEIFGWFQDRGETFDPIADRDLLKNAYEYFASSGAADVSSLRHWLESNRAKKGVRNVNQGKARRVGKDGVRTAAEPTKATKRATSRK